MKEIIRIILCSTFLILSHVATAADDTTSTQQTNTPTNTQANNPGMWICTTNASSATSGSPEEQADKTMANNATNGNSAFDFALKNCRDCTKITCELQTKSGQ
ncbi:hypothetical protein Lsan_2660 [Legionella santicrucis]|uniref:Uncharacterized protein n=1 Tax=Legionella santicrucis TaxID=45074 RepID=A0A0W0YK85_9GAMM|nr:hypothetical protein [Legionella santicrucis]KTD57038.1 hypothetical protein Lsan_2660 [Legionella santicrucis]